MCHPTLVRVDILRNGARTISRHKLLLDDLSSKNGKFCISFLPIKGLIFYITINVINY